MITLYRKNSFGIGRWCIWKESDHVIKFGHSASLQGHLIVSEEYVEDGKAGRSLAEQVQSRIDSRISKMRDKGYKDTADEAAKAQTNQLGLVTPMLAKPLKVSSIKESFIQPKLNGHRCLIANVDGDIIAYSRQGKLIHTVDHVTNEFFDILPENTVVDGELYIHGEKLQTIASLVKREQPRSKEIKYFVYDFIDLKDKHIKFKDRAEILRSLVKDMGPSVQFTDTDLVENLNEAMDIYKTHIEHGFEGSIVRSAGGLYESGKRSSGLLKIKPLFDTEVEVLDIVPGDTGLGICVCRMDGLDRSFKILAPGTHPEKIQALEHKDKLIGKRLKVEYRELTADGVPFHAVATEWFTTI